MGDIYYRPTPTLADFHRCSDFHRFVIGPVGSGKSSAMCAEIMRRGKEQVASEIDKLRHTRWAVVRNTYRELSDTTVKTWMDWFGGAGVLNRNDMTFVVRFDDVDLEVMFRALDRPSDVKKLLSMELTGAWFNECREIPKAIVDAMGDRVGRYPAVKDGGCTWRGIIGDTNPPDDDHWMYRLAEEERPEGWAFFKQPGGLIEVDGKFLANPAAENTANLEPNYYLTRMAGKSLDHIRVYYCARYGFVVDGRPVIPDYVDELHCAKEILQPVKGIPIRVGLDWGLTPAAIFTQRLANGRWLWLRETVTEHMGAERFAKLVAQDINDHFNGFTFEIMHGDPAGDTGAETDERTVFQVFNKSLHDANVPLEARPAPTNDPTLRHGALGAAMRRTIDGKPGFLISPACKVTRKGLAGGYCYKRVQVAGAERYQDKPDKNRYSHPVEAGEYAMIGAGEGVALVRPANQQPSSRVTRMEFDPYSYDRTPARGPKVVMDFDPYSGGRS
jgi:hypothetical protein